MARSAAKRTLGTLLFVVAFVVLLGFVFLLFADAEDLRDVPGTDDVPTAALVAAIALGVIALLLLLLLIIRSYDNKQKDASESEAFFVPEEDEKSIEEAAVQDFQDAFKDHRADLVVYDLAGLDSQKRAWGAQNGSISSYHFPRNINAGVYANDYIELGGGAQLKMRTLLAGPGDLPTGNITIAAGKQAFAVPDDAEPAPVEELPGDSFMAELEERLKTTKDTKDFDNYSSLDEPDELYYDYTGDVDNVIDIEGIGPVFADKLAQIGVKTTARLCYEDTDYLASQLNTEPKRVRTWQSMGELMKVSGIGGQYAEVLARAGIEGIAELKKRSANAIASQINEYLDTLEVNVLGNPITARRVEGWKEAAKSMRRVRTKVPEE